ncbi:glycosyltransferase [Ferviditalea candida]|uniref:Glycosyltransferase n=1 Tax=Ferviditalea candida TaxID=3108399 RepID=A0ABU5ZEK5_9BACL|nr:glycosyltransferase [Paenibacillaceae bacterium T2]
MKKAICVLGMHRSGTSMLMKVLNILGVYLGEDKDILAFGDDNPEGFWEHQGIVDIHEKIFAELNRSWDSTIPLPENWLKTPQILEYKKELIDLIKREFNDVPVWGWKDPRTCILLPLWNEIYDILDIEVSYVISLRNPLDIANSLFKRNNMNKQNAIALWYYHMINVLEYTKGSQKMIVEYDSLLEDTLENAKKIADFIGLDFNKEKELNVKASIKPGLRHSHSSYKELCLYTEEKVALLYKDFEYLLESNSNEFYSIANYKFHTKIIQLEELENRQKIIEQKNVEIDQVREEIRQKDEEAIQARTEIERNNLEIERVHEELRKKNKEVIHAIEDLERKNTEIEQVREELERKNVEIGRVKEELEQKNLEIRLAREEMEQKREVFEEQKGKNLSIIKNNEALREKIDSMQAIVSQAINQSILLSTTKLFKFIHLMYRVKHQLIKGDLTAKRKFFNWLSKRWNRQIYIHEHNYNPLYQIVDILNESKIINKNDSINTNYEHFDLYDRKNNISSVEVISEICTTPKLTVDIKEKYQKIDIILLSIIDFDFRYQRPQHLANVFAENGHRVFYINANFGKNEKVIHEKHHNLNIFNIESIKFKNIYAVDSLENLRNINCEIERIVNENAIRDCLVVIEYPTWTETAKFLKKKYGFKIVSDYLDDFTGFKDTSNDFLSYTSIEMLKISDKVIASSSFLAEKAGKYNCNVEIVRNGTEFQFFNNVFRKNSDKKKRKIVGYYGAVAHWFDFNKIEYLAEQLTDVDIVIIGAVTEGYNRLTKYSNIKLLGEKPYKDLPSYLKDFDVCLIPFDTTTDLIKATNPVKFYEYLSAGKKVVATEIPELMPFKNKYVYLANDNDQFLHYVRICLDNSDDLAFDLECVEFAKENDWSKRGKAFLDVSKETFPKVSIIMLTYNQLDYTKQCISSIIDKTSYPNYELIIVDNNSQDNTQEYLKQVEKRHDQIKVILNEENHGFAGGNNIGLKHATGDYLILLNNDTIVTRGWITGLLKHFDNNPNLGLVGPVTNSIGNEAMIKTEYDSLEDMDNFAYNYTMNSMGELYIAINTLAMFCVAIPRTTFEKIGFLDENYKVGMFEDDDYSLAILRSGYEIACAEDVFIHHFGSVSFKKLDDKEYKKIFDENKDYYEQKWNTKWVPHKYRDGIF